MPQIRNTVGVEDVMQARLLNSKGMGLGCRGNAKVIVRVHPVIVYGPLVVDVPMLLIYSGSGLWASMYGWSWCVCCVRPESKPAKWMLTGASYGGREPCFRAAIPR